MQLATKAWLVLSVMALVPVAALGLFVDAGVRDILETEATDQLASVGSVQKQRLEDQLASDEERVALLASRTQMRLSLAAYVEGNTSEAERIQRILTDATQATQGVLASWVETATGDVVAETHAGRSLLRAEEIRPFRAGEQRYADQMVSTVEGPSQVLAGRLSLDGRDLGRIVVLVDPVRLATLAANHEGLGETGETLLARRLDESTARLLLAPRMPNAMTPSWDADQGPADLPAVFAAEEVGKVVQVQDYRAVPVYAYVANVAGSEWVVVVKMDRDEVLAPVAAVRGMLIPALIGAFFVASALARPLATHITGPLAHLRDSAAMLQAGELDHRTGIPHDDTEIGALAATMDSMAESLQRERDTLAQQVSARTEDVRLAHLQLERILDAAGEGIVGLDIHGRITFCNASAAASLRTPAADLIGQGAHKAFHSDDQHGADECPLRHVLRSGETAHSDSDTFRATDGTRWPCSYIATPIATDEAITGAVVVFRDLTTRRATEAALAETEGRYQLIVEQARDAIIRVDASQTIQLFNPEAVRIFGGSAEEWIGRDVKELVPPEYRERLDQAIRRGASTQKADVTPRLLGQTKLGRTVPIEFTVGRLRDGDSIMVMRDVTPQALLEASLRRSEAMQRAMLVNARDHAIVRLRGDGRIAAWNASADRLFGPVADQAINETLDALVLDGEANKEAVAGFIETARLTGSADWEGWLKREDKSFYGSMHLAPLGPSVAEEGFTLVVRDMTLQHQALEELRRSNRDLEAFAYVASHDLQEPLRTMGGFLEILQDDPAVQQSDDAKFCVQRLDNAVVRLTRLIRDLLAFSRVERHGRAFTKVNLEAVVKEAKEALEKRLTDEEVVLDVDPLPTVYGDAGQLSHVFQNLIGNAVKFQRERPVRIDIRALDRPQTVVLSVTDNGIGIPDRHQEKVFGVFQRLHTRDKYEGTGIGLAICRRIIERHHGRIWLESEEGVGTTFFIELPRDAKSIVADVRSSEV